MARSNDRKIASDRTPGRVFDLYEADDVTIDFIDGIHSFAAGPSVSRLEMFRVIGLEDQGPSSNPIEQRRLTYNLTMPTAALVEFIRNAAMALPSAEPVLRQASDQMLAYLKDMQQS